MRVLTVVALGSVLAYAAFQQAGVDVRDWHWCLLAIGLIGVIHFLVARADRHPRMDLFAYVSLSVFVICAAVQLIPLPVGMVKIVSPARIELLNALHPVSGELSKMVPLTIVPYETAGYLLTIAAYVLVFLLARDLSSNVDVGNWTMIWPLLVVGAAEAALGCFQAFTTGGDGIATGTYANRDHYAGLLELVLPFAALYAVAILRRGQKPHEAPVGPALKASLMFAVAALILVAILFSLSRMGFLAALASLFVGGSIALGLRGWRVDYQVALPWWRRHLPTAVVALTVALGFVFLPTDALIARFSDLAKTDQISADTRAQIWHDSIGLIRDYWAFGVGLGGFESAFLRYKTVAPMFTVDYAHNDYLQVLAELGIFGFVSGLCFVFRVIQKTLRGAVYATSIDARYISIACVASLTAILLHSLVDFNLYVPANGLVVAWIIGIAGVHLNRGQRSRVP
jgi:O-antigen ligase